MNTTQHDAHVANWLKAKFNLTVEYQGFDGRKHHFTCWKGDYDLDIWQASHETVFWAAAEYTACYDGKLNDTLSWLELGEVPALTQLNELVGA